MAETVWVLRLEVDCEGERFISTHYTLTGAQLAAEVDNLTTRREKPLVWVQEQVENYDLDTFSPSWYARPAYPGGIHLEGYRITHEWIHA